MQNSDSSSRSSAETFFAPKPHVPSQREKCTANIFKLKFRTMFASASFYYFLSAFFKKFLHSTFGLGKQTAAKCGRISLWLSTFSPHAHMLRFWGLYKSPHKINAEKRAATFKMLLLE